jgi:predicted esterase
MTVVRLIILLLLISFTSIGQTLNNLPINNEALLTQLDKIKNDKNIPTDSAWDILSFWNTYPESKNPKRFYLFLYKDSIFGTVPLKVYIPENYKSNVPSPAVLILHGAVVLSSFKEAYKDTATDEDLFYDYFAKHNFIVIRPYADGRGPNTNGKINFDWVINQFNGRVNRDKTNPTFQTLKNIITQLKQVLNIDDNKVFAFGHSDGADGVFALEVYQPSVFAGFVVYNSMLTNIFSHDIYLENTLNRPLYLVHSDLDDLRPIQQTRSIVNILDSINSPVLYKEYIGYQHYDKHLKLDLPLSYNWTNGISRNPFQNSITWETDDLNNNNCDWLRILNIDTTLVGASWHSELNTLLYNKIDKVWRNFPYYQLNKSAVVKASYNNNIFRIQTSRVKEIELLISPSMVNLQNPVVIIVNGKEVFNKKIISDKTFLLKNFTSTYDRKAIWVTSIKVNTD